MSNIILVTLKKTYSEGACRCLSITKSSVFFIILFFVFSLGHAQKPTIDSLKKVLATAPAEKKMDAYQGLILKLWLNQPDTAMLYAIQAVDFTSSRSARE